jgi:hypothetical protein
MSSKPQYTARSVGTGIAVLLWAIGVPVLAGMGAYSLVRNLTGLPGWIAFCCGFLLAGADEWVNLTIVFGRPDADLWGEDSDEDSGDGHENAPQAPLANPPLAGGLTFGGTTRPADIREPNATDGWYR